MFENLEAWSIAFADAVWGLPMVALLLGGGGFFLVISRALPYRHLGHGFAVMSGRYDTPEEQGELSHFQALAAALSNTMGLGNIGGVALAIVAGGPGAVFWMWMSAVVGIATKFFTCSLGVMYVIREALPKSFYPLAVLFSAAGMIGTLPMFQANQLTALIGQTVFGGAPPAWSGFVTGLVLAVLVGIVIFGGLPRVAKVAVRSLPTMVVVYVTMTLYVVLTHITEVPGLLWLIVSEAFNPTAVGGGFIGIMLIGVSRGVFSNEAGVGTEVMAHGAARTNEPIREGMVATLGPIFDTLLICTCTALVILLAGDWQSPGDLSGITLTANAVQTEMGTPGLLALAFVALILSTTTMFTGWYFGAKCFGFLVGADKQAYFRWFFIATVIFGASVSVDVVFNVISGSYGLMALPTMVSTIILAPRVMVAARDYFSRMQL